MNPVAHTLRPYQNAAVDSIFEEWKEHQRTLGVCGTGGGKTQIFCECIRRNLPKRALVLVHRTELCSQAVKRLRTFGIEAEIEMAELSASVSFWNRAPCVVASVQTLSSGRTNEKRMHRFNPADFDLLVIDEFHHAVSPSWKAVIDWFCTNKNLKMFGTTATADRLDERALGQVCESVAFNIEIKTLIDDGWLVPIYQQQLHVEGLDFSHLSVIAGDFNQAELSAIMEAEKPLYGVAQGTLEAAYGLDSNTLHAIPVPQWNEFLVATGKKPKTSLCFTVSVKQAENLCDIFNRVIPGVADWVSGKTEKYQRAKINNQFYQGEVPFLVNCGTHTEGADFPRCEVIVPKPTKSRALMCQMVGRGGRPCEENGLSIVDQYDTAEARKAAIAASVKPRCLVVDLCGVTGRHKMVGPVDVLGGNYDDEVIERVKKKSQTNNSQSDIAELLEQEVLALEKEKAEKKRLEQARRSQLVGRAKFSSTIVDPFAAWDITPVREHGWDTGRQLSEKQRALFIKHIGDPDDFENYAQQKQLLNALFARWNGKLATLKQCALLQKHGYDTKEMPMKRASELIDALAKNHWKRPTEPLGEPVGAMPKSDTNGDA